MKIHTQRSRDAVSSRPRSVRIGLIGDFRGRGARGDAEVNLAQPAARLHRIDPDDLDASPSRFDPCLSLTLNLPERDTWRVALSFRSLDDFHPDRLLAQSDLVEARRRIRGQLEESAAPAEPPPASSDVVPEPAAQAPPPSGLSGEHLLDAILAQSQAQTPAAAAPPTGPLEALIDQITAGHTVRRDPREARREAGLDEEMSIRLRSILHHPEFQALESLWTGVRLLGRQLATRPGMTVELIDLTRAELEADLLSTTPLESTSAFKLLVEPSVGTEGGTPWTFLIADLTIGPSGRDAALLWRLGQIARLAGAPLLAAASPRFAGCESFATTPDPDDWASPPADEGWTALRRSGEASFLGLILPRFLLRAPYGPATAPIETFAFSELPDRPAHEAYLWGNPALAAALMLGRAFDEDGTFDPQLFRPELGGLPLAIERDEEGDTRAKPCAEALLGIRAAEVLLGRGLMPLLSVRDQDSVRLARLVSIAEPPAPLALG